MKNWKFITTIILAVLFAGLVSSYGQGTVPKNETDSTRIKMEQKQQELEELAQEIAELAEKMSQKASKEIEKEVSRELKEALREVKKGMEEMKREMEKEWNKENGQNEQEKKVEIEIEEEEIEREDNNWGEVLDGLDIKFNKKKDKLKNVKTRWFLFDLGFASYIAPEALPEINGVNPMEPDIINSVSWRLHVLNQRINLVNHNLNLIYGAGFSFNFYGFSNPSTLDVASPQVNFTLPDATQVSYKKNHLRASYLHFPLMLNIETNPYQKSKSFHINAGVYGNVLLGGKTAQKTNNQKIKIKDKYNLENFQYGLLAQLGYGPITFYGTYGLNELFKPEKDNGYRVHPITFGVKVLPF
ncbi:outer membrane beta-barrel protein [Membranicola marinus]|uniref:Outer membrane beta-barrel protein n=1 Tax=Membranihabitans marinus TaxID=1227546 RepID=A0A953LAX9_9BACT|nr:outer membrane beta-barrel protein [Membranihabitans marinus]MBY5958031.1 outer membrane beta-barrel protein [Membranihabitans marinus]